MVRSLLKARAPSPAAAGLGRSRSDQRKRPLASSWRFGARQLLVAAVSVLGFALVPAKASARSLPSARSAGPVRDYGRLSLRLTPELPVTPVLLGLLALGLATGSFSYARTRARAKVRPRTLEIRPVRLPPGLRAPIRPLVAAHQERER